MEITLALILLSYLLGSLSSAIITCRIMGLPDPRTLGSKNPGATNVLRFGGKRAAAITLFGDLIKGVIPVVIAQLLNIDAQGLALVGLAAFLGHLYPIFFGFQGGKGVATAFGVMLAIWWPVALAALLTWVVMAKLFKISSLSALTAATLSPLYSWLNGAPLEITLLLIVTSVLLIWRHRTNIRNLISGSEDAIGSDAHDNRDNIKGN
jgi:acyl phosphate:glycerol-3-phosphate acyltransferase